MKKITLLSLMLYLGMCLSAVSQSWYSEDFETVTPPAFPANYTSVDQDGDGFEWFTYDASGQDPWTANGNIAGSESYENTAQALTPDNLLIIGPLDLSASSGSPSMALSWEAGATEATSTGWHEEHYSVYMETSTTPGTALFSETLAEGQVLYSRSVDVSSFIGNSAVYLIFRHHSCTDEWRLGIDNIKVRTVANDDAGVSEITMSDPAMLSSGDQAITGVISNYGANTITSVDVSWNIDGGATSMETLTGLSIPSFGTYNFTLSDVWTPVNTGSYVIEISTSNPNGNSDANLTNDMSSKTISIVTQFVQRLPLYENFTSSTCPPCVPANAQMLSLFGKDPQTGINAGKWSLVKYQMNWPGIGDPYYTTEGGIRKTYYGINSVPRVEIDGGWDQNGNALTQTIIDQYYAAPAFVEISSTYTIIGKTVDVSVTVNAVSDIAAFTSSNMVVHMAILEKETYLNTNSASNGETEFQFVMKKMVPDAGGTSIGPLTMGSPVTVNDGYTFNGSYVLPPDGQSPANLAVEHTVEEFNDLAVVVWVQDLSTMAVHQSAWSVYTCGAASATSVDATCGAADGTATASSTGPGTIYQWDDPSAQNTATATGLAAGLYNVVITDDLGCQVTTSVFVNDAGGANVVTQAIPNSCVGGATGIVNLIVTGGTTPYSYLWSNGGNTQNITDLTLGDYTVTVTDGAGCLTFRSASITDPEPIAATSLITSSNGNNGSIDLSVTGGTPNYSYVWDNGATTEDIMGLAAGVYSVTITDGFGCTMTASYTVPVNPISGIASVDAFSELTIYPNPFNSSTTIEFTLRNEQQVSIAVLNIVGELVYAEEKGTLRNGIHKVHVAGDRLAPGIYFVKLQIGESSVTRKIIHN